MDFLNQLDDKLLIVPYNVKDYILGKINDINHLLNFKIISLEELEKDLVFDYDERAILYLMDKYGYKYEVCKEYIDNMYYIDKDSYLSDKLNLLVRLKKELFDNGLLYKNGYYYGKKGVVFSYDYISNRYKKILKLLDYEIIENSNSFDEERCVLEFVTLEEEVKYVFDKIMILIDKGISIDNIYLAGVNDDYINTIKKYSNFYGIPVDLDLSYKLSTTIVFKDVFDVLYKTKSFEETFTYLKDKYVMDDVCKKIINLFNKYNYLDYSFESILSSIMHDASICNISRDTSGIQICTLNDNYFDNDSYVFIMGLNKGNIPIIHKDEDFISDNLKSLVGLELVKDLNNIEKDIVIKKIKSIKNVVMTYKKKYGSTEYYPSNIIEGNFSVEKGFVNRDISYSKDESNLYLSSLIDDFIKYDKRDENLSIYYNSFNIPYREYNNSYTGIYLDSYRDYIGKKLLLSYTTIDDYFKCEFRYYINKVLKLNKYEKTFGTFIGDLFHYVLSCINDDFFDLDKCYDKYIIDSGKTFSNKELFYLDKLKKELVIVYDRIKSFNDMTGLTKMFLEREINIDKDSQIEVKFNGKIDKIMYKEYDGKTIVAVIDYKTGNTDIDIYSIYYGLGMQLFIYLYLIAKSNLFDNTEFAGFYLQKILGSVIKIDKSKTYLDLKYKNLKLIGYSNSDTYILEKFDTTYENSLYIAGMKVSKNGFYNYTKVLSDMDMDNIISFVDKKIEEARDSILKASFNINPKHINGDKEITGCLYCKYKDLCFRSNKDIVNLPKINNVDFLKEGENA